MFLANRFRQPVWLIRHLRHDDEIGVAVSSSERQPACIPSHRFYDDNPVVRIGGGAQVANRTDDATRRCWEPWAEIVHHLGVIDSIPLRRIDADIVVNRLCDERSRELLGECCANRQRIVTANRDEAADIQFF